MQTRNQKSIKFSVFTNKTPLSTEYFFPLDGLSSCVYVCYIRSGAQFPFAFISAQSSLRAGILCTLHLGSLDPVNQLSFDQWVSVSGYNRAHFYCSRFKFSHHRDFVGEGWMMDWGAVSQCHGPDGSRGETLEDRLVLILCSLLHDHRTHPPPHFRGKKLISSLWELPTTKYSNWNWNNKHKHREGRQAAKCAQSSIKPGPGNLVSWVCPLLYSQSQKLTFHWMKEDLNPLTSHGQYVFCFCRIVLHFSFIENVLSLHFVSAWEVQNRKVNPIVG